MDEHDGVNDVHLTLQVLVLGIVLGENNFLHCLFYVLALACQIICVLNSHFL